jgi:hypothetical protein
MKECALPGIQDVVAMVASVICGGNTVGVRIASWL